MVSSVRDEMDEEDRVNLILNKSNYNFFFRVYVDLCLKQNSLKLEDVRL